jgi:hypothetical protein
MIRQVVEKNGSSGRTRINNETYFQQHASQRMTQKVRKGSLRRNEQSANRAQPAEVYPQSVPVVITTLSSSVAFSVVNERYGDATTVWLFII